MESEGNDVIGASLHEGDRGPDGGEHPTLPDHDPAAAEATEHDPARSDTLFDAVSPADNFEHRRVVSIARHRLFGRGQPPSIGRYRIERRIGAGGMGEVYLAHDDDLGRKVAIKRVRGHLHSERVQERLRREARALARLSHPNVVQVYEVGTHEDRTYLAMEFVNGRTLATALSEDTLPWRSVLDKFIAAGRGLAAVHEAGLVHRDFKPDNVLISHDGRVLVADFGLVLAGEDRRTDTHDNVEALDPNMRTSVTGAVLGTIRFMPLEQLRANEVTARSDQFSFCVALYEALWGKPPFSLASSLARLGDLEVGVPISPRSREGLRPPGALWRIVRRGLSKDPAARWPDMNTLLAALERVSRRRERMLRYGSLGAAAAVAVAAGLSGLSSDDRSEPLDPCATIERELAGAWDTDRRAQIDDTLARSLGGVGHASDSRQRVLAGLDRWSAGWVSEREQLCRADASRRIEPERARLQGACLTRQRQHVEDLVELLTTAQADGDTLAGAVEAIIELPPASTCADDLSLLGVEPPPPTSETQVEALRRELARAADLRLLGRLDEGMSATEQTELAARALGYRPLMAEVLAELAKAELEAGSLQRGTERLQEAIDAAELAHHDHLAASLWLELALHSLTELDRDELGAWQLRRAEVANARVEAPNRATARLAFARGQLAELRGDDETAAREYRAAFDGAEFDETALPDLPSYLSNLARIVGKRDAVERIALLRSAVQHAERAYGAQHPQTAPHLYALALAVRDTDPSDLEVVDLLARAVEIWRSTHRRPHRSLAKAEFMLGTLALQRNDLDEAHAHATSAAALQAVTLPEHHPDRGATAQLLATIHGIRGEHEQALEQFRLTLASWDPAYGADDPEVLQVRAVLAATLLALGRLDEADRELQAMLSHVQRDQERVFVHLQRCEIAVRRGRLDAANAELDAIRALGHDNLEGHEFSYSLLQAIVALRRHRLTPALLEQLEHDLGRTSFTATQISDWLNQLELAPNERATLQLD